MSNLGAAALNLRVFVASAGVCFVVALGGKENLVDDVLDYLRLRVLYLSIL